MTMALRNCTKCRRMFSSQMGEKLCSKCSDEREDEFFIVREYIYDHPGSNVEEVSEATGVDEEFILKYLRQGKLELKGEGAGYACDKCGKTITTGKYCDACSMDLRRGLEGASAAVAASVAEKNAYSKAGSYHSIVTTKKATR